MKTLSHTFLLGIILFMFSACATTKTSPERINDVTLKIQTSDFTIDVRQAHPMRGGSISLNSGYNLKMQNDSVFTYLPYFGVARSAPIGNTDGGIKIAEPMENYQITTNKKDNGWIIQFNAQKQGERYDFSLNIFNSGSSSITVNSAYRDPVSFNGEMQ